MSLMDLQKFCVIILRSSWGNISRDTSCETRFEKLCIESWKHETQVIEQCRPWLNLEIRHQWTQGYSEFGGNVACSSAPYTRTVTQSCVSSGMSAHVVTIFSFLLALIALLLTLGFLFCFSHTIYPLLLLYGPRTVCIHYQKTRSSVCSPSPHPHSAVATMFNPLKQASGLQWRPLILLVNTKARRFIFISRNHGHEPHLTSFKVNSPTGSFWCF
jgi:hypothetical protein